jgi:hypothetical protein
MAGLGRKVFTAGDVLTASDVQNYLQDQTVMNFAGTAARSSAIATPSEGMLAITLDNDEIDFYNGSAWVPALPLGGWSSYTPTFTNFTLSNGAITLAKWSQIGKTVNVKILITLGTTSVVSGRIGISLPVTAANDNLDRLINGCGLIAGGVSATGFVTIGTTTRAELYAILATGTYITNVSTSSSIPGTWTTGNTFSCVFTYEAA